VIFVCTDRSSSLKHIYLWTDLLIKFSEWLACSEFAVTIVHVVCLCYREKMFHRRSSVLRPVDESAQKSVGWAKSSTIVCLSYSSFFCFLCVVFNVGSLWWFAISLVGILWRSLITSCHTTYSTFWLLNSTHPSILLVHLVCNSTSYGFFSICHQEVWI